ncbi:hypothetical protein [Anatilimnocola floriformis]|uniref:hypothetical protein n=1 Tax=Anatilimnocola floriformis TaxID=2948575 RepID=UPI0020C439A6|nr:hypothetical protein [Anatilimnocola floriformis]
MTDEERKQSKSPGCALGMTVGIVLLPFAYFFSYGPVIWLIYHDWIPAKSGWIRVVYFPIHWLSNHNSVCRAIYVWWVQLWGG